MAEHVRAFLAADRFLTIATVDEDGAPHAAVVWYRLLADDTILVNSADGRRWPADLRRDPRVAMSVIDGTDGYRWVGLRGRVVEIVDDQITAQADIAEMARRYHADDPAKAERLVSGRFERQHRVSFHIRLERVHDHLDA